MAGYGGGRYLVAWNDSRETVGAIYGQVLEQAKVSQSVRQTVYKLKKADWTVETAPIMTYANAGLAFSAKDSWVFGESDAYHYQNGIWKAEAIFPVSHLYGSWASGPIDIWVTGWCGGFSHYNGQVWTYKNCTWGGDENPHTATALWGTDSTNL